MKKIVALCIVLGALSYLTAFASTPSPAHGKPNFSAKRPVSQKVANPQFKDARGQLNTAKVQKVAPSANASQSVEHANPLKAELAAVMAQMKAAGAQGQNISALKARASELRGQIYGTKNSGQTPQSHERLAPLDEGGETCADATVIPGLPFAASGTTIGHTDDIDISCEYGGGTAPDVTYSFTPTVDMGILVSLCHSWYDTKVGIIDATGAQLCCNDDYCDNADYDFDNGYQSEIPCCQLLAGQTYCIVVDGYGDASGDYELYVDVCGGSQGPANDDCANAQGVDVGGYAFGSTILATADPNAPDCGTSVDGAGVWYTVYGDGTTLTASTCNSNTTFDTKLHVYMCGCDHLTCVTGNDDNCLVYMYRSACSWCSVPGEQYLILVEGFDGATGDFELDVNSDGTQCEGGAACPCWDATLTAPGTFSGSTANEDADCIEGYPDFTVQVTIPSDGQWTFSLCGSDYDTYLAIGYQCCDGTICSNDDDASGQCGYQSVCPCVQLVAGTYYVWISGFGGDTGDFVLTVSQCGNGCTVECPSGGVPEGEGCDGDINGGCNTDGLPTTPIECGETVCGSARAINGTRDTDFYQLVLTQTSTVTWCVTAEFTPQVAILSTGTFGCLDVTLYDNEYGVGPCTQTCATAECLPAGTYWLFVATQDYDGVPCSNYVGHVDCTPCGGCNPTQLVQMSTTPVPQYQCADLCPGAATSLVICGDGVNPNQMPIVTITPGCSPTNTRCDRDCAPAQDFVYDPAGWVIDGNCWYNHIIGLTPGCVCVCLEGFLGVEFNNDFAAVTQDGAVALTWSTSSEHNCARFDVMRDGEAVAQIPATNTATSHNYSWTDRSVHDGSTYQYALVSVDENNGRENLATITATPRYGAAVVTEYALHQNFPNPFNPTTEITFDLVEAGSVNLKVYNLMGQEVAALVNGMQTAGRHTISFNATNLPSGVYLYKLNVNGFVAEKKMVLTK